MKKFLDVIAYTILFVVATVIAFTMFAVWVAEMHAKPAETAIITSGFVIAGLVSWAFCRVENSE